MNKIYLVVLRDALSRQYTIITKLISLSYNTPSDDDRPVSPQVWVDSSTYRMVKQLNPAERADLVAKYHSGISTYQLAREYGINRHTVAKHLQRAGVAVREQLKMTPEVTKQARQLYESGQSLAQVGAHLGVDPSNVRKVLLRVGVKMRDTHGRLIFGSNTSSSSSGE